MSWFARAFPHFKNAGEMYKCLGSQRDQWMGIDTMMKMMRIVIMVIVMMMVMLITMVHNN